MLSWTTKFQVFWENPLLSIKKKTTQAMRWLKDYIFPTIKSALLFLFHEMPNRVKVGTDQEQTEHDVHNRRFI